MATFCDLIVTHWGARFMGRRFACAVGRGGIGRKTGEGDGITPQGFHRVEAVLCRTDRTQGPGSAIPMTAIWSDAPQDPGYNTMQLGPNPNHSHERLRRADPLYDLIGVLDYNRHPVVPGAGSAIFLHIWRKPRHPTEGCIAFSRPDLHWILSNWTDRSRVICIR